MKVRNKQGTPFSEDKMRILVACEKSRRIASAFEDQGFEAWSCDIMPAEQPGNHIQDDVLKHLEDGWDLMIAHPPCTYLSYAGTAHWNNPGRCEKRLEALYFFRQLWEAPIHHICIENPKGCASPTIAKYSQEIQPYYFGDREFKTTWLWLKNLPLLIHTPVDTLFDLRTHTDRPEPITIDNTESRKRRYFVDCHKNAVTRARTFPGIAAAMAQQWGEYLLNPNN